MSLAPNFDVPSDVSPFVPLPLLALCRRCKAPTDPLQLMSVARGGRHATHLCPACAAELDAAWAAPQPTEGVL